jgi:hypothetical protein
MKVKIEQEIRVYPSALAEEFCNMDADEQAQFFDHLHGITKMWKRPFCFQLQSIVDSSFMTPDGKSIMELIGDYADRKDII